MNKKTEFVSLDSHDLGNVTGGLEVPTWVTAGAKAVGDKLGGLFGKGGGGGPQVNTNVQTGQNNGINQNTGSGNQTVN